jgi:hypothetical protein
MTPTSGQHHIRLYNGAGTDIDSEATAGVTINNTTGGGTGPFTVYAGGSSYYNTKLFQVQNNGNGTGNYLFPSIAASSGNHCLQIDNSGYVTNTGQACGTGSGSGSVTSVGLSMPAQFNVANSPVTNSGTLTVTWANVTAHYFFAGPLTGSPTTPTFRSIDPTDVPTLNQSTSGNAATATAADHSPTQCTSGQYSTGDTTAWAANCGQVQYSQLGGSVPTWNQSTSGNAATATALAAAPSTCSAGYAPTGVTASGAATGCAPMSTATWATNGTTYLSTTTTQYIGVNYIESGSTTQPWVAPRAGTVQNCTATANVAESGSNHYTLSLYKNGSYCSGPQIVLNGAQYTALSDNTHTCAIAQGDLLSWQSAVTGTPTAALVTISCSF